jgi:hypothetical protein
MPIITTFLGPLSSASPEGPGRLFSLAFIAVGAWVGLTVWRRYTRQRRQSEVPIAGVVGIIVLALGFVAVGIWGLLRGG